MNLPLCEVQETATVRLVPTKHFAPAVLAPLVDSAEELAQLEAFEGLTNARLQAERAGLADLDARGLQPTPDFLGTEPETAYPAGQSLAAALRAQGSLGLVYPSARKPGGTCLVAFQPHLVQNVRPGARWRFRWSGTLSFSVISD